MAWITVDDVEGALGLPPASTVDEAWLARATASANDVASAFRRNAGRIDHPDVCPNDATFDGTVSYAIMRYKARGSIDGGQPAFDEFGAPAQQGTQWYEIQRLWGGHRPQTG